MKRRSPCAGRRWPVLLTVVLGVVLQAARCPNTDLAGQAARTQIPSVLNQLDATPENWRVHWKLLDRGTDISSFKFLPGAEPPDYTCRGWCVLFFLDLDPFAHFSHPTRILIYESKPPDVSSSFVLLPPTEWWPTIREPTWPHPKSVFNTVAEREDPTLVFGVGGVAGELPPPEPRPEFDVVRSPWQRASGTDGPPPVRPPTPPPSTPPGGGAGLVDCDLDALPVWAILVNGYDDVSDSFDEDIVGMYSVLRGFGVHADRIRCLSPFQLFEEDICEPTSPLNVENAFKAVTQEMEICSENLPGDVVPHFLLFWSSHGSGGGLACNLTDGSQQLVWGSELADQVTALEAAWDAGDANLEVTVVIEACESGTVGETISGAEDKRRWILTSAAGDGNVSYRDIDKDFNGQKDKNPADSGSETIWGYVEAFGTETTDADRNGTIDFDEAVQYAKTNDVAFQPLVAGIGGTTPHQIKVWTPTAAGPVPVHGAWNTSARAASSVVFTAPVATTAASIDIPATSDVVAGETVEIEVEVKNIGAVPEVGALALRIFRNDETAADEKWKARYYEEDNLRTTVMVPGLAASQSIAADYKVDIPDTYQEGDTLRLVADLESGQMLAPSEETESVEDEPPSELILKIKKKCKSICCWWRGLWD